MEEGVNCVGEFSTSHDGASSAGSEEETRDLFGKWVVISDAWKRRVNVWVLAFCNPFKELKIVKEPDS